MAETWQVQLTAADRIVVVKLADRRRELGLSSEYTESLRAAVRLALTAPDEILVRGTVDE